MSARLAGASSYRVRGRDGREIGTVEDVRYEQPRDPSHVLVVRRGGRLARRRVVPFDAVAEVWAAERVVVLEIDTPEFDRLPRSPYRLDVRRARRYREGGFGLGWLAGGLIGWTIGRLEGLALGVAAGAPAGGALGLGLAGGFRGDIERLTGRNIDDDIAAYMAVAFETCAGGITGWYLGGTYGALVGVCVGFAIAKASALAPIAPGHGLMAIGLGVALGAATFSAVGLLLVLSAEERVVIAFVGGAVAWLAYPVRYAVDYAVASGTTLVGLFARLLKEGLPDRYAREPEFEQRESLGPFGFVFVVFFAGWWAFGALVGLSPGERIAGAVASWAAGFAAYYDRPAKVNPRVRLERTRLPTRVLVYIVRRSAGGFEFFLTRGNDGQWQGTRGDADWGEPGATTADYLVDSVTGDSAITVICPVLYRHRLVQDFARPLLLEEVYAAEVTSYCGPLWGDSSLLRLPDDHWILLEFPELLRQRADRWYRPRAARGLLSWPETRDPVAVLRAIRRRAESA